jgi:hypothetical protein
MERQQLVVPRLGMDLDVFSLLVSGADLYAGGYFTTAGGAPANRIAKWNGTTWSALGSGMNGPVRALALIGTDLYVGGDFTTAGGVMTNHIAKWNGSNWSVLGTGMNDTVYALAVSGSDLYAGGRFTTAGGVSTSFIANWNGSTWSALGTGMDGGVFSLAIDTADNLYLGGEFAFAGATVSPYIAQAMVSLRPDVAVGASSGRLRGVGLYSPARQLATLIFLKARPVKGRASFANRGNRPDFIAGRATGGNAYFKVVYSGLTGNVTAGLRAGTYRTPEIKRGDIPVSIGVLITPNQKKLTKKRGKTTSILKKARTLVITAASTLDPSIKDSASIRAQMK